MRWRKVTGSPTKNPRQKPPVKRETAVENAFRAAVKGCTGTEVDDVQVWTNEKAPGVLAVRVRMGLTVRYFLHEDRKGEMPTAETLREIDFKDWPPWHRSLHRRGQRPRLNQP